MCNRWIWMYFCDGEESHDTSWERSYIRERLAQRWPHELSLGETKEEMWTAEVILLLVASSWSFLGIIHGQLDNLV
ncbi:hypothetical protein ACP70R_007877 [Stipagrostis hirtigluma subsp. patula]